MPATPINVDRFYAIWRELLFFANTELRLVPDVPTAAKITQLPIAEVGKIRQAVWKNNQLRGDFIERNPANLSGEDSLTVAHWNHRRAGKFSILRHLKSHSIFIDDRSPAQVYAVHGLYSPLAEVAGPYLPVLVEAVLRPFEDRIIYDGFLIPYNVTFGSSIRGDLNDIYRDAKERAAVLTTLLPAGLLSREDQAAAARTTNAEVLHEFRTYLYRAGLSAQVVERDIAAVEDLANSYLAGQAEPRSLRAINQSDLAIYLSGTPSTAFTSFKRFVKFMAETGRMNWGEADEIARWLRAQKQT